MSQYIDAFIFPIHTDHLEAYKKVSEQVAGIWKEYGALAYFEYVGDDLHHEGLRSFEHAVEITDREKIVFGWAVFPDKSTRDEANKKVPLDPRMSELVDPLVQEPKKIFDASRMVYGGFEALVKK